MHIFLAEYKVGAVWCERGRSMSVNDWRIVRVVALLAISSRACGESLRRLTAHRHRIREGSRIRIDGVESRLNKLTAASEDEADQRTEKERDDEEKGDNRYERERERERERKREGGRERDGDRRGYEEIERARGTEIEKGLRRERERGGEGQEEKERAREGEGNCTWRLAIGSHLSPRTALLQPRSRARRAYVPNTLSCSLHIVRGGSDACMQRRTPSHRCTGIVRQGVRATEPCNEPLPPSAPHHHWHHRRHRHRRCRCFTPTPSTTEETRRVVGSRN